MGVEYLLQGWIQTSKPIQSSIKEAEPQGKSKV